jgi:hypothetical protein
MNPTPIPRRDLLLLRATPHPRVYELPCQQLYMRYVDASRSRTGVTSDGEAGPGEPETVFAGIGPRGMFAALAVELRDADVLRIRDREWLADPGLRREVDALIARFTSRGGRVEFGSPAD